MRAVTRLALPLAVILLAGGGWFLLSRDMPAPSQRIEIPLPDVRAPR